MIFQPVLPIVVLLPLCLIVIVASVYLCMRSVRQAKPNISRLVITLRGILFGILAFILFIRSFADLPE